MTSAQASPDRPSHLPRRWPRRVVITVFVVVVLLIIARLAAPTYIQHAMNARLAKIPNYSGHVGDIDLQVWRGAYRLNDVKIVKSNGQVTEPFFGAKKINFSIAWREIFRGKLVSDISIDEGALNFVQGKTEDTTQLPTDRRWQEVINDIFPIEITRLRIRGGILRFVNTSQEPKVDIAVRDLQVEATGLRNRPADDGKDFPAAINLSGRTIGNGQLRLFTKLEPLAEQPHFDLNLELKDVSLPALNDFLRAYANVDVSKGRFELFGQMAVGGGRYEGYAKPFLDQLDFSDLGNEDKNIGQRIWETIVAGLVTLVKNKEKNQFATRIPFSGETGSMNVETWTTIVNTLRHGFVEALHEGFEGTTHPDDADAKTPSAPENLPPRDPPAK